MDSFAYKTYGAKSTPAEVEALLQHLLAAAFEKSEKSIPTPLCIWGKHGIGKTELVQDLAKQSGWAFQYLAPAQFEEMGDLIGMPRITETDGKQRTIFAAPDWVPKKEGPGILLIDDVNRADDRILRGIMQLLQQHELISWKLPDRWQIILTANPDGGDYSVTPMDEAMLTRMLHVTMEFDLASWLSWAEKSGQKNYALNFASAYPEVFADGRTTPRSIVQFFNQLHSIQNPEDHIPLVKMLGDAVLDPETTVAFINFIRMQLHRFPGPEEILNTTDFKTIENQLKKQVLQEVKRVDIVAVLCDRMTKYLLLKANKPKPTELENLKRFLLLDFIPNDLRLIMIKELLKNNNTTFHDLMAIPELSNLLIEKM